MITQHKYRFLHIVIFTALLTIFSFSPTMAQSGVLTPNPGGPITVDGDIADWDLTADYFTELRRTVGDPLVEGAIYLHMDFDAGIMSVLVLTNAPTPNVITTNPQETFVKIDTVIPTGGQFSWVNQQGDLADGWEASFPIEQGTYIFKVHTPVDNGGEIIAGTTELPIAVYAWDYGDLPDTYGTYEASNGPKHATGALRLGMLSDGEPNGQPSNNPILDNLTGKNDEDGANPLGNWRFITPLVEYSVNGCAGTCYLNLWIDWDEDGSFEVLTDTVVTNLAVTTGTHTISFDLPSTDYEFPAILNVRIRLCDQFDACATPNALSPTDAPPEEVEDYQWQFSPTAVTINSFSAASITNPMAIYTLAGAAVVIMLFGVRVLFKKRALA